MWRNALIATITVLVGFLLVVFSRIDFLLPYKRYIVTQYATRMEVYVGLLAANLFAFFFLVSRKVLLKDTGRKLAHLERQLQAGQVASELSERLKDEELEY